MELSATFVSVDDVSVELVPLVSAVMSEDLSSTVVSETVGSVTSALMPPSVGYELEVLSESAGSVSSFPDPEPEVSVVSLVVPDPDGSLLSSVVPDPDDGSESAEEEVVSSFVPLSEVENRLISF